MFSREGDRRERPERPTGGLGVGEFVGSASLGWKREDHRQTATDGGSATSQSRGSGTLTRVDQGRPATESRWARGRRFVRREGHPRIRGPHLPGCSQSARTREALPFTSRGIVTLVITLPGGVRCRHQPARAVGSGTLFGESRSPAGTTGSRGGGGAQGSTVAPSLEWASSVSGTVAASSSGPIPPTFLSQSQRRKRDSRSGGRWTRPGRRDTRLLSPRRNSRPHPIAAAVPKQPAQVDVITFKCRPTCPITNRGSEGAREVK